MHDGITLLAVRVILLKMCDATLCPATASSKAQPHYMAAVMRVCCCICEILASKSAMRFLRASDSAAAALPAAVAAAGACKAANVGSVVAPSPLGRAF